MAENIYFPLTGGSGGGEKKYYIHKVNYSFERYDANNNNKSIKFNMVWTFINTNETSQSLRALLTQQYEAGYTEIGYEWIPYNETTDLSKAALITSVRVKYNYIAAFNHISNLNFYVYYYDLSDSTVHTYSITNYDMVSSNFSKVIPIN